MEVRAQTLAEEAVNCAIHLVGLILVIASAIVGWPFSRAGHSQFSMPGTVVYLITMIVLFGTSATYHALPEGRAKRLLMTLDYCTIYLFIAGTYTPIALGVLSGHGGMALLIAIWSMAAVGIALHLAGKLAHPAISTGLYLSMGWLVLTAVKPLVAILPIAGLTWLTAGGLSYTAGIAFFLLDSRMKFAHAIWHLFVLAGSACHFATIAWYS